MALTQSHYRFGIASGTESTHGFLAAEDTPISLAVATQFLLRFCVQANATGLNNVDNEFQYRLNGGAWTNVTTTSAVARTGATAVFANAANCTKRLSGTGTFETTGAGCTHTGVSGGANNDIVANGNSETLIGMQIIAADVDMGDEIEFRLTRDGGLLMDTYAVIPKITVLPQTQVVLAQQNRGPATGINRLASGSRNIGARGIRRIRFDFPLQASQRDDAGTVFSAGIERSTDGGTNWQPDVEMSWSGGRTDPKTGLPIEPWLILSSPEPNVLYRGWLDLPAQLNIGCVASW